ncbi:MAG TPA: hypothetical protein VGO52_01995 [Hyphomonadaceae bacterium]|jgi:hypothetical protein|nr:hypothetical protein [Hyphomonadaceae bacterium]
MQADQPEHAEDDETGADTGPWALPRWMLGEIAWRFCENISDLLTRGLTRRAASHLARWLWSAEAIVRRLLLAAAAKVTLPEPSPRKPAEPPRQPEKDPAQTEQLPKKLRSSFHTFAFCSVPPSAAPAASASAEAARSSMRPVVGVLPLDPLLRIGAEGLALHKRGPARQRHSARQNRFAESDLYQSDEDYERALLGRPSKPEIPGGEIHRRPVTGQHTRAADPWGFQRCLPGPFDDETLRPAPALASRVAALVGVLTRPEAAARRLAATLARRASLAQQLAGLDPPFFWRKPNDPLPSPPCSFDIIAAHKACTRSLQAFHDSS